MNSKERVMNRLQGKAVRSCLDAGDETSFISSGCEIPVGTPHENLLAVSQALSEYGRV